MDSRRIPAPDLAEERPRRDEGRGYALGGLAAELNRVAMRQEAAEGIRERWTAARNPTSERKFWGRLGPAGVDQRIYRDGQLGGDKVRTERRRTYRKFLELGTGLVEPWDEAREPPQK